MKDDIINKTMAILQKLAGLLMFAMVVTVTVQLVARNFLKISTPWTEDTSKLLLVWMTFIGSPVVLFRGEHLMVDLIYVKLHGKKRIYVNAFMQIVILAFCVIGFKLGLDLCSNRIILHSTTAAANIPRVYIFSALPVGSFLMMVVAFSMLIHNILVLLGKREDLAMVFVADESRTLDEIEGGR